MKYIDEKDDEGKRRIDWRELIRVIVQAIIAALTALGVASCATSFR